MGFTAQEVRITLTALPEDWEVMIEYTEDGILKRVPIEAMRTYNDESIVVLQAKKGV